MPLLPAFPGKPDAKEASSLRGVMHWQYRSICRGEKSIYHRLYREMDDPFAYIAFYGLRNYSMQNNVPVTEEIYIHSKTMIVDDTKAIIGSANINERSMTGDRDSEIAVLIEDTEFELKEGIKKGVFAHAYRMQLMQEHFGVPVEDTSSATFTRIEDPVPTDNWFALQDHAMKNTQVYETVFGVQPSDSIVSFEQLGVAIDKPLPRTSIFNLPTSDRIHKRNQSLGLFMEGMEEGSSSDMEEDSSEKVVITPLKRETSMLGPALNEYRKCKSDIRQRADELSNIKGQAVYFPLNFLANEDLEPKLLPSEIFQ